MHICYLLYDTKKLDYDRLLGEHTVRFYRLSTLPLDIVLLYCNAEMGMFYLHHTYEHTGSVLQVLGTRNTELHFKNNENPSICGLRCCDASSIINHHRC